MMMKKSLLLITCITLSGCTLEQELDQWSLENYEKKCESYGFKKGTDAFSNCLLKQQELEDNDLQHQLDRSNNHKHKK
jgi:hypothetical protein